MRATRRLLAPVLASVVVLSGCSYAYRNPAEDLGPGEVGGRTVAGVEVLIDGVAVGVKGAALDATSRANGRFAMLPLPVGRHTLMFRKGKERALQREVEIAWGKDGQPQGLWLGDVTVPAAVTIAGECEADDGHGLSDNGVAVDEVSGAIVPVRGGATVGGFAFEGLSVGQHRIRVFVSDSSGSPYVGGPVEVTLLPSDAGTRKTLTRLALHRAGDPATDTGLVRLKFSVAGARDVANLRPADLTVTGLPPGTSFGSDGVAQVDLPEGLWTVAIKLPAGFESVVAPRPVTFVAVKGKTLDLGTLYAVAPDAPGKASRGCHTDADCAPGACGSGGICDVGYVAPVQASAGLPWCDMSTAPCDVGPYRGVKTGNATVPIYGPPYTATCASYADGTATVAVACGASCTPDGINMVSGDAGVGGCSLPVTPLVLSPPSGQADIYCNLPDVLFTVTGGTPPYHWNPEVGRMVNVAGSSATWSVCDWTLPPGAYTLTVTDSGLPQLTQTATISVVDTRALALQFTVPADLNYGVPTTTLITATFNKPLDPATVDLAALDVTADGVPVAGAVALDAAGTTITFTPAGLLPSGANIAVTLAGTVADLSGGTLGAARGWGFGVTDPLAVSPTSGWSDTGCGLATDFTASGGTPPYFWSADVKGLRNSTGNTNTWDVCDWTLTPGAYTLTLTDSSWPANTVTATLIIPDSLNPFPWSHSPSSGATGVPTSNVIQVWFTQNIDPASLPGAVGVLDGAVTVPGEVTLDSGGSVVTFTPTFGLPGGATLTVVLARTIATPGGRTMTWDYSWTFSTAAAVQSVALPRTGALLSKAAGDDAAVVAGVAWPFRRFTQPDGAWPLGGPLAHDPLTGLEWPMDNGGNLPVAGCATFTAATASGTWAEAVAMVDCLNTGAGWNGHADWRLPNIVELRSLLDAGGDLPSGHPFKYKGAIDYWSSTSTAGLDGSAWSYRTDGQTFRNPQGSMLAVWPVRGGTRGTAADSGFPANLPRTGASVSSLDVGGDDGRLRHGVAWPVVRFAPGVGLSGPCGVADALTGLSWIVWPNPASTPALQDWAGAMLAPASSPCGLTDWRVPNVAELASLLDYGAASSRAPLAAAGLVNAGYPGTGGEPIWSATPKVGGDGTGSFVVDLATNEVRAQAQAVPAWTWLVRGGLPPSPLSVWWVDILVPNQLVVLGYATGGMSQTMQGCTSIMSYTDGTWKDVTAQATWVSSDTAVGVISSEGYLTTPPVPYPTGATGTTTITAAVGNVVSGGVVVTVTP